MARVAGRHVGKSIVDALGLNAYGVKSVTLNFDVAEVVTATVVIHVTDEQLKAMGIPVPEAAPPIEYRYDDTTN